MFHTSRLVQLSVGMAALWLVILGGGISLVGKGLAEANAAYKDFRLRIGAIEEKRDQFDQAYQRYQSRNDNIQKLEGAFLNEKNVLTVVSLLEQEARNAGVGYTVAGVSEELASTGKSITGKTTTKILPGTVFHLELSGSLSQIWEFVRTVQRFPYFLQLQRVSITVPAAGRGTVSQEQGALSATVVLKVYHLPAQ